MRRVSTAGAVFVLLAIFITPTGYADDPPLGTEPPAIRIQPPSGLTSQIRIEPPSGLTSEIRILPPGGVASQVRIAPVGGVSSQVQSLPPSGATSFEESPSMIEMFWLWLQTRID